MTTVEGHKVSDVIKIGSSADGEHLFITLAMEDAEPKTLFIPIGKNPSLLMALMTAGGLAYKTQLETLGTQQAVLDKVGFTRFAPSGLAVMRAVSPQGSQLVVLRLQYQNAPVVDVEFSVEGALAVAQALHANASQGDATPPSVQ